MRAPSASAVYEDRRKNNSPELDIHVKRVLDRAGHSSELRGTL